MKEVRSAQYLTKRGVACGYHKVEHLRLRIYSLHSTVLLYCILYSICYQSPWSEREIWSFLKGSKISKTREATTTKIGLHVFQINLYVHEFFEPIPFFDPHGL